MYYPQTQVMGVIFVDLEEALELAYSEHGLAWYESGEGYETGTEYEFLDSDREALDWLYGKHRWEFVSPRMLNILTCTPKHLTPVELELYDFATSMLSDFKAAGGRAYILGTPEDLDKETA